MSKVSARTPTQARQVPCDRAALTRMHPATCTDGHAGCGRAGANGPTAPPSRHPGRTWSDSFSRKCSKRLIQTSSSWPASQRQLSRTSGGCPALEIQGQRAGQVRVGGGLPQDGRPSPWGAVCAPPVWEGGRPQGAGEQNRAVPSKSTQDQGVRGAHLTLSASRRHRFFGIQRLLRQRLGFCPWVRLATQRTCPLSSSKQGQTGHRGRETALRLGPRCLPGPLALSPRSREQRSVRAPGLVPPPRLPSPPPPVLPGLTSASDCF